MDSVIKDLGDVHTRLFDHHAIVQGEIKLFIKEFEKKDVAPPEIKLQRTFETTRDLSEKQLPDTIKLAQQSLPRLQSSVNQAIKQCNALLDREDELKQSQETWLRERRAERDIETAQFMKGIEHQRAVIDREKEEDNRRVEAYYKDLHDKLKLKR